MKDKYVAFYDWQRGGMTHYKDCWQGHLTCALIYATELLKENGKWVTWSSSGECDGTGYYPEVQTFIDYIEANK